VNIYIPEADSIKVSRVYIYFLLKPLWF